MSERPEDWPDGVTPMTLQDLKRLGTDRKNQLYWDGKIVRSPLRLSMPQTVIAVLATLASLATIFSGLNNAAVFFCARGVTILGCP